MANLIKIALLIASSILLATGISKFACRNKLQVDNETVLAAEQFENWAAKFGKFYASPAEKSHRLAIFTKNLNDIMVHNAKGLSWTEGLNQFTDMSIEEFKAKYTGLKRKEAPVMEADAILNSDVPNPAPSGSVDWIAQGAVTPIKNQGQCGSCWAFSTTGSLEGLNWIHNQPANISSYSEQQLVDCSWLYGNQGCNGGLMQDAFKYVIANGITTEADYPYVARDQTCKTKVGVFKITGFKNVPKRSSAGLAHANLAQPISVSIDAENIMKYQSGIYSNPACGESLDHGVLLVGYTPQYWHVKNSWGTTWGEQGYIRFGTNAVPDAIGGICGILLDASFPIIA
jgi:Papain family cysteine protease/Cathepsin propeptide inhibitor domain (I29)